MEAQVLDVAGIGSQEGRPFSWDLDFRKSTTHNCPYTSLALSINILSRTLVVAIADLLYQAVMVLHNDCIAHRPTLCTCCAGRVLCA